MTSDAGAVTRSVYPSGGVVATAPAPTPPGAPARGALAPPPAPILPEAPARLSTMTGWPHFSRSFSATSRAVRSFPPPGGLGTLILFGFLGGGGARGGPRHN